MDFGDALRACLPVLATSPLAVAVVRPTRFDLPQATNRTPSVRRVQLEGRLRYHTCVGYSVGTPCKFDASAYASFVVSYVLSVCFFSRMDIDFAFRPSINAIEKCCAVCSHLDTLACSSCVSCNVRLGETLTSRSAVDVGCFKALVCSNG